MTSTRKTTEEICQMIEHRSREGKISCAEAHRIAKDTGAAPDIIGKLTDNLKLKLTHCQLGLFGHTPEQKRVAPASDISEDLRTAITGASEDGRISCKAVWDIALRMQASKQSVGNACEGMKIRIKPCQLGAFKSRTSGSR